MGDDEWDEFNNDFEDEDIEIYDRKHFEDDEDEEEDFGFAQHDGDFGGDDSEFEDEEELDLTEFDDLEEDEDTW
jgi:hypothetical protein